CLRNSSSTFCAIIAQLTEETQPLFETTLKSYAVSEDADAKFTCIVTGYPQPEVTWYKDDEEMDRYCGLPKYEIFRHGNRHTLQLYKCREEDAAIYQASARNNKGIVSCSGVLEVGTMTEYKIHQRWFAKLKRNAEAKLREIEQSRKRGKENVELEQLRRVSPDRFQRKRRLTGEVGMRSGTSLWDKEEVAKVHIPDGKPRFGEDEKSKETSVNAKTLFPNNFITGHLEAEVTTNGDSSLESGEENGDENANGFLTYIYETVEIIKAKPTAAKEFSAKKKKKEEVTTALPNASQDVSREEDGTQQRSISSAHEDATPNTLAYSTSPFAANGLVGMEPRGPPRQVAEKPIARPYSMPPKADVYFSLKDMYFDMGVKAEAEQKAPEAKEGEADRNQPGEDASVLGEMLPAAPTEQEDPSREAQGPSVMVLSQDGSQHFSVTSQNPPVLSLGTTLPIGKEQRVLREDVKRRSPRFGSDRTQAKPAPSHESKDLAAPGSLVEESSLEPRPTVILERYAPQIDTASNEKQEEAFEVQGDKRSRLNRDLGLEGKRPPAVTARPLLVPEVAVEAPVSHQSISEEPHPVPTVAMPLAFQESAPLSPDEEGSTEKQQSVAHLLRDVKREIETWQPSKVAASESEQRQVGNTEVRVQEEPPTPLRGEENQKESFGLGRKMDTRTKERERTVSEAPAIQDSGQTETAMEEDQTTDKAQNTNLVSSLKNYLLLLLKMTTEADKSKGSKKQDVKAAEERTPPTAIPKHLPDVGIAGLTPRTSRKIFERVETNQLFQSAENLQLTPKTSRRITGMINQELLACKESLVAEPEATPLPCVPSIVVGSVSSEPAGPPDTSPEVSGEAPSALPSATPQELASGARRKIYLTKAKQADEMEGAAPDGQPRAKRGSPTVSPQQGRKNATLLQSPAPASPPVEKRSPTTARKMATLEVPKIYEEIAEENKNVEGSSPRAPEKLEETTAEVQASESRKANDPFKAPQVIRKIRAEQFSDASGNLKLWCQFFNILGDSKLTWYKDEVPVTDAKRSSGDEGQAALAIVQVSLKDCGVYQCTIQNEYGTDSTDFLLSAEVLSGFISKEEIEVGEEIEMTPMVFAKGLADSGFWGDKLFGRIMMEDLEVGQGYLRKACRARAIYGLEPVFESGHTGIIKVRNLIAFGGRSENTLVERNYDITIQECKIQNSSREYCKIFAAEAKAIPAFGLVPEIIPLYLIYRPANNIPYATMEEDLPGQFECYCGRRNGGLAPASLSEVGQKCCAFQHWLYQWTNGNILVTDLEGVEWKVTNVKIATKTKGYQGLKESCSPSLIDHFEASHQCNHFCHLLGLKSIEIPQPPPKGKGSRSPIMGRKTPSAQSSPQLQKKGLASPQASRKGSVSPKSTRKCPENAGELQSVARPKGGDSGKASWLQ
uniref:non-specific serine/threonine protein kinase n=1 Tax=Podarcis muralis TaxID=64176 RepID=A0A670JB08_PODMU